MMSYFALEVAKYPKSSPKPRNFRSGHAYCFTPLVMQLVCLHFYPCDAMLVRVLAVVMCSLSICLSVHPSHTGIMLEQLNI